MIARPAQSNAAWWCHGEREEAETLGDEMLLAQGIKPMARDLRCPRCNATSERENAHE